MTVQIRECDELEVYHRVLPQENLAILEEKPSRMTYGACSPSSTESTTDASSGKSDSDDSDHTSTYPFWRMDVLSEDALNRFRSVGRTHAYEKQDVLLCWKMSEVMDLDEIATEGLMVTLFRNLRLLHLCKYDISDILLTLAFVAHYVIESMALDGIADYKRTEVASLNISMFFYLAASHVIDTCAPLFCWTKHVFLNRVSTSFLAQRAMLLFRLRKFSLQVDYESKIEKLYEQLTIAVDAYEMQPELTQLTVDALPRVSDSKHASATRPPPPPYSP